MWIGFIFVLGLCLKLFGDIGFRFVDYMGW